MTSEPRYYACYECASSEGQGCVIFQYGIRPNPVVCPCGYSHPKYTLITDKLKEMLRV